jgi:hypothetical protein
MQNAAIYQVSGNVRGPVVQRWVSANPGLKFNPVFKFMYFYTSVYFKTSERKTPIDPDKISKEISLNFRLTQG